MPDKAQQKRRTNRVFKSLHKPLTYQGAERTLFYFVCVGAVGVFNLLNSILAGVAVFIGGFAFGHWVTNSDPAFLRILAKAEVAHTLILGMTGTGKSYLARFLLQNAQKYAPLTFIFDIGGSFQSMTTIFDGRYLNAGHDAPDFIIKPLSLAPTKHHMHHLCCLFGDR